ncbi:MAG TPA: dethiobiotin synthase [Solirubrobacteraceae bacterium]|jgi:dethiobiotin synthetase|nr:dethiobiotin synthase [Solirubrobacteraceae bacterium]
MGGLLVTGSDTGAGKSVVSAAILAALVQAGRRVRAHKPALSGLDEPAGDWPRDHELLASLTGQRPEEVAPIRFGPAVSPHLAAELAGAPLAPDALLAAARQALADAGPDGALVVEGVGGLLVPLCPGYAVRDLARELGLPVVVAARAGLGTINHSLLTLQAARTAGLDVRAIVLGPWPAQPDAMLRSNRETIAREGGVEVAVLGQVAEPSPRALADAGAPLAPERWLG